MAIQYGLARKRVGLADIHSTVLSNMTMTDEGQDINGGYYVTGYVNSNAPGCGNPIEPSIAVNVKNEALPGWKKITFKSRGTFTAACWWLNEAAPYANNISTFSTAAGDSIFKSLNCFELPQFTVKTFACDNDSTNAFHPSFLVGSFREWYQTRRRNVLTTLAGPSIGLSCNSVGTGATITISDIYIFL